MNIERAKTLKVGDKVSFPPDRGNKGGPGCVRSVSSEVNKNINGVEYVWVNLGENGVWPSNRLNG